MTEKHWFQWDKDTLWTSNHPPSEGEDNRVWCETGWLDNVMGLEFHFRWHEGDKHVSQKLKAKTDGAARREAEDLWLAQYEGCERGDV